MNPTVGDIEGNARTISAWIAQARGAGAQLVVFPEQTVTGYPAEDLWLKPHFLNAAGAAVDEIASGVEGIVALIGFPEHDASTYNSVAVLADGRVHAVYRKVLLPNYGVFDERRYFEPGDTPALIEVAGLRIGLTICEDIWYPGPPASVEALAGASLIVNPSASPYHRGRGTYRERMVQDRARETGAAFAVCNLVGGQDELVFDGHSVVVSGEGRTLARGPQFAEQLVVCDLELAANLASRQQRANDPGPAAAEPAGVGAPVLALLEVPEPAGDVQCQLAEPLAPEAEVYDALKLGLRDYVRKNGFERVLVAVSGGIDSALVTLIATDALGPERVSCVVMPSPHSSAETQADARAIVRAVGADLIEIPIEPAMRAYDELLTASGDDAGPSASGPGPGTQSAREVETRGAGTELAAENIQARIRGNLMMALSNRFGWLVLTTGNKSEMSVGYATLYGDMAGGFAVIKDVPKTLVYRLVRYRNGLSDPPPVPESVLERAPSAELRPGQLDQDSLPPYELLDRILTAYVEEDRGRDEIIADGVPAEVVDQVIAMVDRSEYKRRQAPPGIRITPRAFGRDRRLPITNRFGG
ncbi:MAG: NAD+ synthase [Actinobacteria bacterium 13_1_20CM_3_68_9]|nr:MAG: NAD+ synthase [Actinobacteria bacterium 13_1_20CM_3_68_9]